VGSKRGKKRGKKKNIWEPPLGNPNSLGSEKRTGEKTGAGQIFGGNANNTVTPSKRARNSPKEEEDTSEKPQGSKGGGKISFLSAKKRKKKENDFFSKTCNISSADLTGRRGKVASNEGKWGDPQAH